MTSDHVYAEDQGTNSNLSGVGAGDNADGANFGSAYEAIGNTDFVVRGLSLSNVSGGTFDLSAGKAVVTEGSANAAQSNEVRDQSVAYVVEVAAKTGLSYTQGSLNSVFLDVLLTDDDALDIVVNNAAVQTETAVNKTSIDDWNRILETDFRSYWLCAKHAYDHM